MAGPSTWRVFASLGLGSGYRLMGLSSLQEDCVQSMGSSTWPLWFQASCPPLCASVSSSVVLGIIPTRLCVRR